jgi:ParB-like chromosome segregation protein Spo0J
MDFKDIELETIDFSDETFRITENLDSTPLLESLREIGQLNPVILLEEKSRYIVICGFRRLHALRRLGTPRTLARVVSGNDGDSAKLFLWTLRDNLSHRQFDPLEKARILSKLKNNFKISDEILIKLTMLLLGLSPHENVLRSYLRLHEIHPDLRTCLVESRLTLSSLETLAQLPADAQERIAALMGKIRLSASLQRKFFDVLEDLDAMAGSHPGAALEDPEALAIIHDARLSSFQKGEQAYEWINRRRNPSLTRAMERFRDRKKRLDLPGSIKISADPFFENPGMHVEFDAPDLKRFRELVDALHKAAHSQAMEDLFRDAEHAEERG